MPSERTEQFAYPTVTALIEREKEGEIEVLVQVRRDTDERYDQTLELPTGKIRSGETPFEAMKREVVEENGLEVASLIDTPSSSLFKPFDDPSSAFIPFMCVWQTFGDKSWCGFVIRCRVKDHQPFHESEEVREIKWIPQKKLRSIFETEPQSINSFHLGIFELYCKTASTISVSIR